MIEIIKMFFLCIIQNASFTMVSRARNSNSFLYHGLASVASNTMFLLVFKKVSLNLDNDYVMIAYVVGAVIGSLLMHYVSMKFFEKKKK